jgi:hypothetical protein
LPLRGTFFFCLCESDSAEAILGEGHEIAMHLSGAHNGKNLNWLDITCQWGYTNWHSFKAAAQVAKRKLTEDG